MEEKREIEELYEATRLKLPSTSYSQSPIPFNPYFNLPKYEETVLFYDANDLQNVDPNYYYYSTKVDKTTILSKLTYRLKYFFPKKVNKPRLKIAKMKRWNTLPNLKQLTQKEYCSPLPKPVMFNGKLITGGTIR